jgi:hypothetical protein
MKLRYLRYLHLIWIIPTFVVFVLTMIIFAPNVIDPDRDADF